MALHFLDVGQGDATLVVDHRTGQALLVDCHPNGLARVQQILADASARLSLAVITHFHADHYGAIPRLLSLHPGAAAAFNPVVTATTPDEAKRVRAVLRNLAGDPMRPRPLLLRQGDTGGFGDIEWRCHSPDAVLGALAAGGGGPNRASVVLEVLLGRLRVLLAADADAQVWATVLARVDGTDILRVSHHGGLPGPELTPADIVGRLAPSRSIVSVGTANRYGHPDAAWPVAAAVNGRVMCTEVTALCHPPLGAAGARTGCAGEVTVRWWRTGQIVVTPDDATHTTVVDGWDRPACRSSVAPQAAAAIVT